MQPAQHVAVLLEGLFVPLARLGFDARPFDRDALGVLVAFGGAVEVFAPAPAPPVAGEPRLVDGAAGLLPLPPLVVGVIAFDLVAGSGAAPQEPAWKVKC